jgi:hypothetical protein
VLGPADSSFISTILAVCYPRCLLTVVKAPGCVSASAQPSTRATGVKPRAWSFASDTRTTADAPSASAGEFAAVTVPPAAAKANIGGRPRSFASSNYPDGETVSTQLDPDQDQLALCWRGLTLERDSSSRTSTGRCPGAVTLMGAISSRKRPFCVAACALR